MVTPTVLRGDETDVVLRRTAPSQRFMNGDGAYSERYMYYNKTFPTYEAAAARVMTKILRLPAEKDGEFDPWTDDTWKPIEIIRNVNGQRTVFKLE